MIFFKFIRKYVFNNLALVMFFFCAILTGCSSITQDIEDALITPTPSHVLATNTTGVQPITATATPNIIASNTVTLGSTETATNTSISPTNTSISGCDELLTDGPWRLEGDGGGDAQAYQEIPNDALDGKVLLQITIDLNGVSFNEGPRKDESAIIIDQEDEDGRWTVASVVTHNIENGKEGEQIVYIPLAAFEGLTWDGNEVRGYLDLSKPYGTLHARFWNQVDFIVEIASIKACSP